MPRLMSSDFTKDLPEITTSKYFEKKKRYHRDGLFSEHIFGLEKSYTCRCGTFHGKYAEGQVCNKKYCDGLEITNNLKRRRQYAKIVLPIPVLNRTFLSMLRKIYTSEGQLFMLVDKLMKNHKNIIYINNDNELIYREVSDLSDLSDFSYEYFHMHDAVEKIITDMIDNYLTVEPENENYLLAKQQLKDHLFKNEIIVIPPAMRPISQINATTDTVDQLNQFYYQLLVRKEIILACDVDIKQHMNIYQNYYSQLQYIVDKLHEFVIGNISKKEGLIRGNILGKRIDFSGRAVIAPSPHINLDECVLPYKMVLELYKIKIANKLKSMGKFRVIHHALKCVEECQFYNDPALLDICREIVGDDVCLLNRQPSLHKLNLVAFKIKVDMINVIYIHPMVCSGFNADFDGDSLWSKCRLRRLEHPDYIGEIADLKDTEMFEIIPEKEKENVSHYAPTEELYIKAISLDDGSIEEKKILDYSEHRNLKMFSINDPQNRFEEFWVSDDHSLIVWDENEQKNLKISPEELLENPEGRYLVQQKY